MRATPAIATPVPSRADWRRGAPRKIVGFRRDGERQWVAELECGHTQHVRHDPPWQVRPWVLTPEGRARFLGRQLRCVACARAEAGADVSVA